MNGAIPGGVLETEQQLNPTIVERLKTSWRTLHRGTAKAHEIAILEGGVKWRDIASNRKDMDFVNLNRMTMNEILLVFGVPSALLGILDNVNNSIMDNVKKIFWENTLLPKMEKIEAALNYNLVWPYDDTLSLMFDRDAIEALKGSQEIRARIASMLVDRGIFTQNEARSKYFSLPPVDWGDTWYMPLNLTPVDKAGQGLGTGTGGTEMYLGE